MLKKTMLELDASLFVISLLIWLLLVFVEKLFVKPVGKVVTGRESRIKREEKSLESAGLDCEEKSRKIEQLVVEARSESLALKSRLVQSGESKREKLVEAAKKEAEEIVKKRMVEFEKEVKRTENLLQKEIAAFSEKINAWFV